MGMLTHLLVTPKEHGGPSAWLIRKHSFREWHHVSELKRIIEQISQTKEQLEGLLMEADSYSNLVLNDECYFLISMARRDTCNKVRNVAKPTSGLKRLT